MRIAIESTDQLTMVGNTQCRVWQGTTESGTPCTVFVLLIAARSDHDISELQRELIEQLPPPEMVPLQHVLP